MSKMFDDLKRELEMKTASVDSGYDLGVKTVLPTLEYLLNEVEDYLCGTISLKELNKTILKTEEEIKEIKGE